MTKRYDAIDGLRTIACIGIVMMHMAANNSYSIDGFIYRRMIPSFTDFVFLFMTVSAFGMCCGYYKKVLENKINLSDFYTKRFKKILPFFACLVLLDVIISPSVSSLYEAFADITLMFGFLPNAGDISVIGVGWFLGLIFVFYLCFPFFCVLLQNKRRAWIVFIISLIYNFVCINYFDVNRTNILYSACFFIAGGLIYLYKDRIEKLNVYAIGILLLASIIFYYTIGNYSSYSLVVMCSLFLMFSIIGKHPILENPVTKFISNISFEIYLSHMVIFRLIEKVGINTILGNGWLQYIITVIVVLIVAALFSVVLKKIIEMVSKKINLAL